jgi:hypothetical protein
MRELKMKNYVIVFDGQAVPTGSKYYSRAGINRTSYFYNDEFEPIGNKSAFVIHLSDLKELPEAKWEPAVGEECEVTNDMNVFEVCIPRFLGDKICIIDFPELGAFESHFLIKALKFRPLKSAKELEREAFKTSVSEAIHKSNSTYNDRLEKISSVLFDAGFTAPNQD